MQLTETQTSNPTIINASNISIITPKIGQHAAFVGQNGSGKSFLAKKILGNTRSHRDILIIDPKCEIGANGAIYFNTPEKLFKSWGGVMIYAPSLEYDNSEQYNKVFEIAYRKRNCLVFIDELYAVCDTVQSPDYLRALYTRGRSLGISVFGCTQRPSRLPLYTLTEAKRFYVFRLTLPEDRKRLSGMIGTEILPPTGHNFIYFDETLDKAQLMRYEDKT